MTPSKVPYFTKLDPALRESLRLYKASVGVPEAEQIDRALRAWLAERPDVMSAIATKYRTQLDAMTGLHEAAAGMMRAGAWTFGKPGINRLVAMTMMGLLTKALKTFKSIQFLCERGLHEDANALARVLLETTVAIAFILQEKPSSERRLYHAHGWVQQIKMLKHWKRTPSLAAKVTNEVLKRGQDALETYEKMFPETIDVTRHWSGTGSLEGALTALGDETTYAVSFRFTSAISHATDFGAHFESDGDSDEVIWQIEPRVRGFEAPSYAARELLWKAAHRIDERLGLGFDEKLAPFQLTPAEVMEGKK